MRLPIAIPLDTRDGTLDQDGHLTNAVAESYEDKVYVIGRPGLSLEKLVNGAASGIVCFNGSILSLWGSTVVDYVPVSATTYNAGTTYDVFDVVMYDGTFWLSLGNGNTGNTPSRGSSYWTTEIAETTWDESADYDVGDSVKFNGVTYYSQSSGNTGNLPTTTPILWSTTPAGSSRFIANIFVANPAGGAPLNLDGGPASSANAAGYAAYIQFPYQNCATKFEGPGTRFWWEFQSASVASGVYVNSKYEPSPGLQCAQFLDNYAYFGTVTQTV
jgi:hypothetical protein